MSESAHFISSASNLFIGNISNSISNIHSDDKNLKDCVKNAFFNSAKGLELVERCIISTFKSEAPILSEISNYLVNLGGKRVRPLLAILSSKLFASYPPNDKLVQAAAGIELIHMATLLHDDIIDGSKKRRNKESAFSKFGLSSSLLAGDFLWVRAFGLCAHLGEYVINKTESACVELTEGEILEGKISLERKNTIDDYLNIISRKTAALFELSCAVGAHFSKANTVEVDQMACFGRNLGLAFQIVDDILDVTADENLLGKPSGTDLKQKTPSLINILWLKHEPEKAKDFFSQENPTADQLTAAVAHLRNSAALISESKDLAKQYAEGARSILNNLKADYLDGQARDDLTSIIDFTLQRCL